MTAKKGFLFALIAAICFTFLPPFAAKAQTQDAVSGQRIAGEDRYITSVEISKFGWQSPSGTAIVATGGNFPDALCAAPLAKKYNAPILLTDPAELSQGLADELARLNVSNVYIVGGAGVVSQKVEDQLTSKGIKCSRIFGDDRYATSAAVASEVGNNGTAVITTGSDFPDALSIASWAASNQVPILLTDPEQLPKNIEDYIKNSNITSTYVIGGTGAVSDDVMSKLPNPNRIQGEDRYATNLAVLKAFDSQFDYSRVYLATGENFPDALSGSAMAALSASPIILTSSGPLPATREYMDQNKARLNEVYILGGEGVVSDGAIEGVIPPVVTAIELALPSMAVGMKKKMQISANITMIPSNAPKPNLTYSILNPDIAGIEQDGKVTGIMPGTATVVATAGGISSSIDVPVILDRLIMLDPGHGGWSVGAIPISAGGEKLVKYKESVLNMQVVQKIKNKLASKGANVVLTRQGDTYVSLEDRAKMANDMNADMFISIHHDSSPNTGATGTTAYYSSFKPGVDVNDLYAEAAGTGPVYDADGNKIGNLEAGRQYPCVRVDGGSVYILFNGSTARTTIDYVYVLDRTPSAVSQKSAYLARSINQGIISLGIPPHGVKENNFAVNTQTNCVSALIEVGFISNSYEFEIVRQDTFQEKVADKIVGSIVDFYLNEDKIVQEGSGSPATP